MNILQHADAHSFNQRVRDFLRRNEALHHSMLSRCYLLLQKSDQAEPSLELLTLEEHGDLVGVAIHLPGRSLWLSSMPSPQGVTLLAKHLKQHHDRLSKLNAPSEVAQPFAQAWTDLAGQTAYLEMTLCAYQLTTLRPFTWATGQLEPATEADIPLVSQWFAAFGTEALGELPAHGEAWTKQQIDGGHAFLWHDGQPVSMGCRIGQTEHGFRVSIIYTPPEQRQKGYGKTCTAALTQRLLQDGQRSCCLYADQANGVTNRMYAAIGYELTGESQNYRFEPLPSMSRS